MEKNIEPIAVAQKIVEPTGELKTKLTSPVVIPRKINVSFKSSFIFFF